VLSVEDWAEIRRLHRAERMPIKAIARVMGVSKNTVKRALTADGPPQYARPLQGSIVGAAEPRIRELLAAWPSMPATVIAERIGWTRSMTVLKDRVRELRPAYLPPDPASRTAYAAGEVAQCDLWFPDVTMPVGFGQARSASRLPVLVMVTGYARWLSARLLPSRGAEDLFAGWWRLIDGLGGVPRVLVWDGEGAFPGEIFQAPRSWVQNGYPTLMYYNKPARGGHFAAWEEPQLFSEELRAAFRSLASGARPGDRPRRRLASRRSGRSDSVETRVPSQEVGIVRS
jgi:hypothetical protein